MSEFWQKYKDPRWQKLRLQKMEQAKFQCEHCEDGSSTLNVHHKRYRRGANPWEYELWELECLCEACHEEHHELKNRLNEAIASLDNHAYHELLGFAQALAAKRQCEDVPLSISPMHADGVSAAFAYHDYGEVLSLPKTSDGISLESLWGLYGQRKNRIESNGSEG
jgi:hypothetical protein